ncbi:fimbrial biogenesis usher protein [Scandinavium sp. H11S7]|uniref:fimbrial biogenesis usher protein n=1 Tax=Scandinavium hiltneri TaxID=2926519 RepID=UPI0021658F8F|nr:fimbrial biogenesis usher protein [Scandinavium hiltneri]MCS2155562.1 fimbrial biogenesis usher protein [Scandinavium hiltneri]
MLTLSAVAREIRRVLRVSVPVILLMSPLAQAREYTFDTDILQHRGLNTGLSNHFAHEAKYLPGTHSVSLQVNGKGKGVLAVRFGAQGELCVDNDFLAAAGLQQITEPAPQACHDYRQEYPTATITPLPNTESLLLVVPPEAVNNDPYAVPANVLHGGTAAVLNYNLFDASSRYEGGSSDYRQASLEGGINFADWLLRSNYVVTDNDGNISANSLYTYVAHTFVDQKIELQAGQVNAISGLFSGTPITGLQLAPANALIAGNSGVTVRGIARGAQARVEVRQTGQLVYSTLVPAGPFTLDSVPIVRTNTDLDITVVETDGSSNHFVISASTLRAKRLSRPQGLSISFGQVREVDSDYAKPLVANISDGWSLSPQFNLTASGVMAVDYQAAGAQLDYLPSDSWSLGGSVLTSNASFGDARSGVKSELSTSYSPLTSVSLSLSAAKYSDNYRELTDALNKDYTSYQSSYNATINWEQALLGTFSLGYNLNKGTEGNDDSRYVNASWGKTFKYASVQMNWQSQVGSTDEDEQDEDLFYVNVSIPFGEQNISTHYRQQGDDSSAGVTTSGSLSQNSAYSLSVDRDLEDNSNSFNGNLNTNLHYTQLSLGAGGGSHHQSNYNMTLSGGVVAHDHGVTFSPYNVKDTFAIARLSEPVSGIEMSTPQGTVWTDAWGQAVVPGMPLYRNARIEINGSTLPKSMDLANGTKVVAVGHGSVSELGFKVLNSRRVMIRVKNTDGKLLPKGISIVDQKGRYVVTSVDDGQIFLNDIDGISALYATNDDGQRQCQIHWKLADKQDPDAFYEQTGGVCR